MVSWFNDDGKIRLALKIYHMDIKLHCLSYYVMWTLIVCSLLAITVLYVVDRNVVDRKAAMQISGPVMQ
jgi:hypothetical protein